MENRFSILVVDDEIESLRALERSLRRIHTVFKATSGEEGLGILEVNSIDLILTDQRMPGLSGVEFLEQARAIRPKAVRMIITAYTDTNDIIACINNGKIYHFFTKPWDPDHLRITLQRALEDYAVRMENERLMKKLEQVNRKLHFEYRRDPLTRLLNRRGIEEMLEAEKGNAGRRGSALSALLLDIDEFKRINDTFGLSVGDVVLQEVSRVLVESMRISDHICRVGGDEFLVLLPETNIAEAATVARRIQLRLERQVLTCSDKHFSVSGTVGIARVTPDVCSLEEVLAITGVSLLGSKLEKERITCPSAIGPGGDCRVRVEGDSLLDRVIRGDGFYAVAQPIMELAGRRTIGYELLIRTALPGIETPDALFRFAIQNNVLNTVDLRCLQCCISQANAHRLPGIWHVNLFPSTLVAIPTDSLLQVFRRDLPGGFCVELSEQQFIGDPSYLREPAAALRRAGISLAVDDLGFGRSSLESLIVLEPEVVKIDKQYVRGIGEDQGKQRDLARMHRLLGSLKVMEIGEGIEYEIDLEMIQKIGIAHGQGFLLGRPEPFAKGGHSADPERPSSSDAADGQG